MSAISKFTPCSTGEASNRRRGYSIRCCNCPKADSVPFTLSHGFSDEDEEKTARIIERKFISRGWIVGRDTNSHYCLACGMAKSKFKTQESVVKQTMTAVPPTAAATLPPFRDAVAQAAVSQQAPNTAPEPRRMSPTDTVLIMSKMKDVYIDADKGYGDGWTDAKLANDLGVPRAWVKEVREGVYGKGSAGNDDITEALREGRLVIADVRTLLISADRLEGEAKKLISAAAGLRDRAHRVERTLAGIEASLK